MTRFEKCLGTYTGKSLAREQPVPRGMVWQGRGGSGYRNRLWGVTTHMEATGRYLKEIEHVSRWAMWGQRSNYCVLGGCLLSLSLCERGFQDLLTVRPSAVLMFCGCISSARYVFSPWSSGWQSACALLYYCQWHVWLYTIFPHDLINGMICGKKIIEHPICSLILSKNLSETFFIPEINKQDITNENTSSSKVPVIRVRF